MAEENQNINIKNKNNSKLVSIKTNDCIKDESILVEMFNKHFINIVEETSSLSENDEEFVNKLLKHMKITQVFKTLNVIKMKL